MNKPTTKPNTPSTKSDKPVESAAGVAPANEPSTAEAPKELLANVAAIDDSDLDAMLKVLRGEARRREREREASRPKVGSKVRIMRGRPKYVGKVGTAVVVRKSRCFVAVPDISSPAYLLIADVELVET